MERRGTDRTRFALHYAPRATARFTVGLPARRTHLYRLTLAVQRRRAYLCALALYP